MTPAEPWITWIRRPGVVFWLYEVGGQREAHGLHHVDTGTDQQERQGGGGKADPARGIHRLAIARQDKKREGHDRKAPKLVHRALPDVGHAAQTQR